MTIPIEAVLVRDGFTNVAFEIPVVGAACGDKLLAKLIVVVVQHRVKGGETADGELSEVSASLNIVNDEGTTD